MILLTGGAGYIGSHCAVELLKRGYQVVILDNLVNSYEPNLEAWLKLARLPELPLQKYEGRVQFIWHDLNNPKVTPQLEAVLRCVHTVIHLAALKSVPESVANPLRYYRNNLDALLTVLEWVKLFKIPYIVFSSSATVYGDVSAPSSSAGSSSTEMESGVGQVSETSPCAPTNPYGFTKLWGEQIIRDFCQTGTTRGVALRYMNPYGSLSEELAETPRGLNGPNNLYPVVLEVAQGKRSHVTVYGSDYPTRDGTGERDYVHVQDVAEAHARVIECWSHGDNNSLAEERFHEINIGTGRATSVLEVISAVERDYQIEIPYKVEGRRPGDVASLVVNVDKAWRLLHWKAKERGTSAPL